MSSLTLLTCLPRLGHVGAAIARRSTWSSSQSVAANPRFFHASSRQEASAATDAIKQAAIEVKKAGETATDKAFASAEHVSQKTKDMASKASATAQDVSEKAKQTGEEAWGKARDSIQGKVEQSREKIKDNAETVKESMNTKN
ncbi:hypothetical protein CJ030_MR5G012386 [Morella rubra]|uniref:Uncharacterized protein n=1 Tax=Morella rubra TaxID=262757 RepID=A0A6A1VLG6_9ROSI|nr:hypothetical protein CJ030_MR5G012386 [Morella rubra]